MMSRIEPSVPLDEVMQHIEELVGPPEAETPEEADRRHEMYRQDCERRKAAKEGH